MTHCQGEALVRARVITVLLFMCVSKNKCDMITQSCALTVNIASPPFVLLSKVNITGLKINYLEVLHNKTNHQMHKSRLDGETLNY